MKTILTAFLTLATLSFSFAQNPDKALARITYNFTHIQDTTQKDKPYTENMLLVIGKNASVYTSLDKINNDLEMKKQIAEQMKNQAGSSNMTISINKTSSKKTSDLDYFYFVNENKFYTKERLLTVYLVEENAPKINWKITKDTASFSGINCQKATATFKGRNWIAWFAPELPFQSGPWKLNGLPGLIIDAYDDTNTVRFQFAGLENVSQENIKQAADNEPNMAPQTNNYSTVKIIGMNNTTDYYGAEIKLPADAVKTNRKEIDKLKEARDKDPQGFMNAQMAGQGISMARVSGTRMMPATTTENKITLNNPLELAKNK